MKERCYVKTNTSYSNYGGRGIKVCDEWQEFVPFMKWAYENGYDENAPRGECTLDRIDSNGDYCPENCRWVNSKIQANNRRTNVYIKYNGELDTLSNHARKAGLKPTTVEGRKINGVKPERMFRKLRQPKLISYNGTDYTVKEFCNKFKVSRSPVERRILREGENPEDALKHIKENKKRPMKRNRKVYQYDSDMNFLKEWDNASTVEKVLGFKKGAIRSCCLGTLKTSHGFIWKYEKI